ncbi:MAG TPA: PAS domain S-box protein, partial [Longimicrobium sp.]|nr:PAS domain S-box protein [Longimicrobium sp.]
MTELAAPARPRPLDLLAAHPDGVLACDRELRVTVWNPAMERLAGISADHALGRALAELLPSPGATELAEAALAGRDGLSDDWCLAREDGGAGVWVQARYAPLRDEAGGVCGCVATLREVGDRGAEAALRESEQRFRQLADTAPVMVWMADPENLGTYFNRPWLDFTGRALHQELGAGWIETIHPDDLHRAVAYCSAHVSRREPFRMEFRMRRGDGEYRWVLDHGTPRFGDDGEFLGYVGSCVDITDRKRAEEALRASEQRYRSLVEATTQMVWTTDARGMVTDMPFWREMTGQTPEEVREQGWAAAVHSDDRERTLAVWSAAVQSRGVYEAEYRLRLTDGSFRWFAARAVPVTEPDGTVREWVGVFNDVHDRRMAEAALRQSEERYRLATLATRDVVWDWDLVTDEVSFGDSIRQVLGFEPVEVDRQPGWWYDHIHPEDRDRVVDGIHQAIDGRAEVWTARYRHLKADGEWAIVDDRAYLLYGDDGRPVRMVGATQDVTERLRAEQARDSERRRLRDVLAQMPAAISVHEGPEMTFVALSDAMRRVIGPREVLGLSAREAIPELAAQGIVNPLEHVYHTGERFAATAVHAWWDADGDGVPEEHIVDYVYHPLRDADGRVYGVVSHVADVTQRERSARELAAARREAEARADEAARLANELSGANAGLRDASARAEEGRRRIEVLAEASSRLSASLDYRQTVQTVAELAVPTLADWCFVEVKEEGGPIRLLACGHQDPAKVEFAYDILRRYPIEPDAPFGTAKVLRTGEPEFMGEITPEMAGQFAKDDEHRQALLTVGF